MVEWPVQATALRMLRDRLEQGTVPHAMLFVGDLTASAELTEYLAKLLLCTGRVVPCHACPACQAVLHGNHPDLVVIDGAQETVKTADVGAMQARMVLRSHAGGRRVYVIRGIDNASQVAANRLLKMLEEPAQQMIALLTAKHAKRLLPTILSRCVEYRLTADGDWGDPLQAAIAVDFDAMVQWVMSLLTNAQPPLELAEAFLKLAPPQSSEETLRWLSTWLRDVLHVQAGAIRLTNHPQALSQLQAQAASVSRSALADVLQLVLDAKSRTPAHVAAQLNVERLCILAQRRLLHV